MEIAPHRGIKDPSMGIAPSGAIPGALCEALAAKAAMLSGPLVREDPSMRTRIARPKARRRVVFEGYL